MGRPRDEFSWAQVEITKDGWICKFCKKDFKGSASRIRNHLSGQGTAISACPDVPEEIRNEALKKGTRNRQQRPLQSSSSSSTPASLLQNPSSSSNDTVSFTKRATDEYVTDAFIKFLMGSKFSSVGSEVLKDPYFREYMERACKYGAASSLLQSDSLVMDKSLLNIKQEVSQYMLMVKESWKITGCTVIMFNLNRENKGKSFVFEKDRYVCGFYCPKGFIFVEAPRPDIDFEAFKDALKRNSPSMDIDYADLAIIHHSKPAEDEDSRNENDDLGNDHVCDFSGGHGVGPKACMRHWCFRNNLQRICIKVCSSSEWAKGLIDKAIKIQQLIQDDEVLADEYGKLLPEKAKRLMHKENVNAKGANGLSNFLSIMLLEGQLKDNFPSEYDTGDLDDYKFWLDGRILERVLNLILKIPDVMDTLVPTAGYLAMAISTVEDTIFKHCHGYMGKDARELWKELVIQLRASASNYSEWDWEVYGYLNPFYYLQRDPLVRFGAFDEVIKEVLCVSKEEEELKITRNCYYNVCTRLPKEINLRSCHPVKIWEKYGGELPTLQNFAIKFLSQPVTCMCNQVKKHLYELQGADDVVLRLNLRMMEEFKLLGGDSYKPIDLSELEHWR